LSRLIPGQALIYERANNVVYARYRDPPHNKIPRWIIGGDPTSVAEAMGIIDYDTWKLIMMSAEKYPTIRKQLDKLMTVFNTVKSNIKENI